MLPPRRFVALTAGPLLLCAGALAACSRRTEERAGVRQQPAARSGEVVARAPGALRVARGMGTLDVSIDPSSLADLVLRVDAGMVAGVEADTTLLSSRDGARRTAPRHAVTTIGGDLGTATWTFSADGAPDADTRYVAEMEVVFFETDVAPTPPHWDPHAGRYRTLSVRTLRQAEE